MPGLSRKLLLVLLALALAPAAAASALVVSIQGIAQVNGAPAASNQRVSPGGVLSTGAGSKLVLSFDDGMRVTLDQNTELGLVDFSYSRGAITDRVVLGLSRGAVRVATGRVATRYESAFTLRTVHAAFGVREAADFVVAMVNPVYLGVAQGTVVATNWAGTTVFSAGASALVADASHLPATLPASSMPPFASSAFANLGLALPGAAGGVASGAAPAPATQGGSALGPAALAIGAAAALAAAASSGGGSTTTHH